ncbi:protein-associating with the carboxyl-terminal domain of ezrin [Microplitis demolitor]|uniref:protein-associating with the carboxyl-terminal domain of ezrin n=1 Tax=Microplitis demolitor TaxID=69319 RepID=UPI0004CD7CFB|nr:protein-associating with the carboxyl-terminal domain of ezrin [Microplitis demolitor]XP_008553480.1 protein-associating with the carboxyl-terminal domain of ezrin [Microplitis demolitor]
MGNEKSALSGLKIDEKAVEITDFWLHHSANLNGANPSTVSVFISEPSLQSCPNFGKPSPLERTAKNLMLHRHPCILKYISSWRKGSSYYLATEEVKPLAQVIGTQTTLQICIGLHSILRALIFLHEKALASHNNVCSSSIYVTPEGSWKLGGLEFLCRFTDFNQAYLKKIKNFRYEKAIAPEEDGNALETQLNPVGIDQYAFGVLTEEVLRLKNADDVPALAEFKEICRRSLQNPDPLLRTKLSTLLSNPFFTHDFINIHEFLMELPLKTEAEKEEFFSNLVPQLKAFPEKIVAEQLGRLLLSRMVLLDSTAQQKLLPCVLKPKTEDNEQDTSLFTVSTFKSHLVPKLLQMFCVRDTSIRLLLLSHLNSFIYAFQLDELKNQILPELLVGIKDHDDHLVSTTLRALADLVPILGAAAVIGGKRGKLFTDGRPNHNQIRREVSARNNQRTERANISNSNINNNIINENGIDSLPTVLELPERPSPDGGEDRVESDLILAEEESTWSDWDAHEVVITKTINTDIPSGQADVDVVQPHDDKSASAGSEIDDGGKTPGIKKDKFNYNKKNIISDIRELDIKHSKTMQQTASEEVDFFTDMEPIIEKQNVIHIEEVKAEKSVFDVKVNGAQDNGDDDGWGEDLDDWGDNTLELED